jgi:hypothetical protein
VCRLSPSLPLPPACAAAAKITEKWEGCLPVGAPLRLVLSERVDLAAR